MASLTYANIETRVLNRLRIPVSNTTEATKVAAVINDVYRDLVALQDWWWLEKRFILNTEDDYTTGTVAATKGSTTVTFSTAPAASQARRTLLLDGNEDDWGAAYRISTHTAGATTATLDAAYTGTTVTTSAFQTYLDTYSLPVDCGKILTLQRFGYRQAMEPIGPDQMDILKASDTSVGKPQWYTVRDFATTGDPTTARQLTVHPYPDETYRLEVHYKQTLNTELSGSTRPLLPDDFVNILEYGALSRCYPIFLADVTRGAYFRSLYEEWLGKMQAIQREKSDYRPQLTPADQYRSFYHKSRRLSAARADLGTYFDRYGSW